MADPMSRPYIEFAERLHEFSQDKDVFLSAVLNVAERHARLLDKIQKWANSTERDDWIWGARAESQEYSADRAKAHIKSLLEQG